MRVGRRHALLPPMKYVALNAIWQRKFSLHSKAIVWTRDHVIDCGGACSIFMTWTCFLPRRIMSFLCTIMQFSVCQISKVASSIKLSSCLCWLVQAFKDGLLSPWVVRLFNQFNLTILSGSGAVLIATKQSILNSLYGSLIDQKQFSSSKQCPCT